MLLIIGKQGQTDHSPLSTSALLLFCQESVLLNHHNFSPPPTPLPPSKLQLVWQLGRSHGISGHQSIMGNQTISKFELEAASADNRKPLKCMISVHGYWNTSIPYPSCGYPNLGKQQSFYVYNFRLTNSVTHPFRDLRVGTPDWVGSRYSFMNNGTPFVYPNLGNSQSAACTTVY